jgi:hypothetical protein
VQNEDLAHVTVQDKAVNLRICPYCFLERSNKPMTPSNFAPSAGSMLSGVGDSQDDGAHKIIEFNDKRNNFKTDNTQHEDDDEDKSQLKSNLNAKRTSADACDDK